MFIFSSSSKLSAGKPSTYQPLALSPFMPKIFPRVALRCAQAALIALSVFGVSACSDSGGASNGTKDGSVIDGSDSGSDSGSGSATTDTSAPTLTLNPESGANIGSASNKTPTITATFSETVQNVNATNVVFKQGSTVLDTTISGSGTTYTITPNADLASSSNYTLAFKAGITDSAGNALAAVENNYSTPDWIAPTLTLNPESGASIGSTSDKTPTITATFSETVQNVNATNVVFKQGGTVLDTTISGSGTTYTITPNADLASSASYTLAFKVGITDSAGNALVAVENNYSTPDWLAPTLTITPADNATSVSRKPNISLNFSETVTGVTAVNVLLSENNDGSSPITTTLSGSGSRYTLTPTANLAHNTAYHVVVKAAQIKDAANNPLGSANQTTQFTTYKSEYPFTALMGATNSTIDIDGSLPDGAELYSSRDANCDIANITACTQGQSLMLNNQTITDTALTATNTAYYKVKYQSQTAETKVPDSTNASTVFSGRSEHQAVVFKDKLWLIGGIDGSNNVDVWSSADGITWKQRTASAGYPGRSRYQVAAFDNKLWVMGGYRHSGLNDVYSSEDGINWTKVTDNAAFPPRYDHQAVAFKNALLVIGGSSDKDVWSSTDGANWSKATTNAIPDNYGHQVVEFKNKLWVIGGGNNNYVYSSGDGITWENKTTRGDVFTPRDGHQAVVFDNKLWVIGGEDASHNKKNDVYSSEDGINWTKVTDNAAFTPRYGHQVVVFKDKLWLIGGRDASGNKNDVWASDDGVTWRKGYVGKLKVP